MSSIVYRLTIPVDHLIISPSVATHLMVRICPTVTVTESPSGDTISTVPETHQR